MREYHAGFALKEGALSSRKRPWSLDKSGSRCMSEAIVRLVASDLIKYATL